MRSKKNIYRDGKLALNPDFRAISPPPDQDYELKDRLKNLLVFEEGRVVLPNGLHVAYRDSKGIYTIGYGFNLQDGAAPGVLRLVTTKTTAALIKKTEFLTEGEAQGLLLIAEDVALKGVRSFFPDFNSLDLPRRVVLSSMVYQFGAGRFGKFRRLIPAVRSREWPAAVLSMQQSQWYRKDSPKRARRMVQAMRTGSFPASATLSAAVPREGGVPPAPAQPVPAGPATPPPPRRGSWPFDN